MSWVKTYKSMPDVGLYPNTFFDAVSIDEHWNWLHTEYENIYRMLTLDAQYQNNPEYIGGVPASGIALDGLVGIRSITMDQNNPDTLFGIYLGRAENNNRIALIVKAYRSETYTWSVYGSTVDVNMPICKRVYTDETTYTDTQIALASCRIPLTPVHAHLEFFEYQGTFVVGMSDYFTDGTENKSLWHLWFPTRAAFNTEFDNLAPEGKEKSPEYGPESEPGGYGPSSGDGGGIGGPAPTFDDTSDPWVPSGMPPSISALGFLNLYKCGANSLINLGAEMYPEIQFPTSLQDVGPVIAAISDSIWNSRLIDFIVSIHMVPCDVPASQTAEDIKLGVRTMLGIQANRVTSDYVDVDLGSIKIDEYYTSFADYMTKCKLFLPFYGFINLKPEYWQSATINVKYRFNVVDGSFIAAVTSTVNRHQKIFTAMVGQYAGSACIHLPASGASYASIFSGLVSNASGAAVGMATGNPAAAGTSIMNTAAALGSGGEMQYSNPYNATAAIMGQRFAYVIIERPVSHFSFRYAVEKGIPLLVAKTIGECSGFTTAEDIILDGIPCTSDEKERIRNYFKSGVIIR